LGQDSEEPKRCVKSGGGEEGKTKGAGRQIVLKDKKKEKWLVLKSVKKK
jgi:hypothetical protein